MASDASRDIDSETSAASSVTGRNKQRGQRQPWPFASDPVEPEAFLAAIVESSDDAIIGKTLDGQIRTWNAGAERVFGYTAEEAIGKSITILMPPERLHEESTIVATLSRGLRIDHYETERVRKDGQRIHVSLSVSPIRDATGAIVGAAKIARDVTLRKTLDAQREQTFIREQAARNLAEAANRTKDAFLAMVSHELRSPLSPILAWVRMLQQGVLDKATSQRALATIERSARAQAQLVDDLLDISRIAFGKLRLQIGSVDLDAVATAAVEIGRPTADAKGVQLDLVPDRKAIAVAGDSARLQQVVWNLVSNAIKFTPRGGRVQVTLKRLGSGVQISVSDTGRGITPEFLPHLFEWFQQAETGPARAHGGLGLGLAIGRHIVELHGGTIHAASEGEGKGATLTVWLPAVPTKVSGELPCAPIASELEPYYQALAGLRILVVDDEPDTSELISTLFTACGAEVRPAGSAADGFDELTRWRPDVVVSDIGMPGEDGFAFIAKVRGLEGYLGRLPAIALTAYATPEDRVRIFSAGFHVHVVKPFEPGELVAAVANISRGVPGVAGR
jgi:PAS domain S-box-containing protein